MFDANFSDSLYADQYKAAGFQLALWEVVYGDDYNLATGAFQGAGDATVQGCADGYLAATAKYGSGPKRMNLTFLESLNDADGGHHQNLVTTTPVPLPAAGLMLLGAFGG